MYPQQPDNQKNLLLAILLSIGVLLGWQYFYAGPKLKEEQERLRQAQQQTPPPQPSGTAPSVPASGGQAPSAPSVAPRPGISRQAALKASPRVAIETPSLKGSIALKGGRIDDLELRKYHETVDPSSPNVVLFSPAEAPHPYFAEYGWTAAPGTSVPLPGRDTLWSAERSGPLRPGEPVTLSWDNGQGLKFRRTIEVDENYLFKVTDEVENTTGSELTLFPYARVYRYGTPAVQGLFILHEGLIGVLGAAGLQELTYSGVREEPGGVRTFENTTGGWLGFTDKYWAAVLIPNQSEPYRARMSSERSNATSGDESYQADYLIPAGVVIPAGSRRSVEARLFAGAKQVHIVDGYQNAYGIEKFELLIDWGWFYFITKPLFFLLNWLYSIWPYNYGVAILLVTILIKAAFFPLANKSYESMAKMKKLQPEMKRIQERYKDDKTRQQQELMALYKKEKINPLAGCLPILVQIPVFFALYKVLFVTIDMRHAPFYGWIQDLSAPDPTSLFNLFGLLPIPAVESYLLGHTIGAWPVLMGATMWLQMQLNPQQPDPIQQQIFNWMPVIFTVMLAGFASGLVIYWAWNNVLSIAQQIVIMRRQGVEVPLMDNLGKTFAPLRRLGGNGRGESLKRAFAPVRQLFDRIKRWKA
ncbi:MAG TPA: membrane protein insertase YidC [Hyphomicrobiaceae bacterium]|nr:membrane protein insertase YidC [Hyphomicrobiaceae bacterium]